MSEEIIQSSDLIADNVFAPTIESAQALDVQINKLLASVQTLGTYLSKGFNNADPKNLSDIQAQNKATQDAIKLQNIQSEATKIQIKNKNLLAEATRQANAEDKATRSAYSALQLQYSNASKAAKDLAAQYGITSIQAKGAADAAQVYGNKLKAIDASVGQYTRNVGNYTGAVGVLGRSLRGFGGLGVILSNALGIDPLLAQSVRESGRAFIDLHHAQDIEKLSAQGATVANEELGVSVATTTEETKGATVATGVYGFALKGITALSEATGLSIAASWAIATGGISLLIGGLISLAIYFRGASKSAEELKNLLDSIANDEILRSDDKKAKDEIEIQDSQLKIDLLKKQGASINEIKQAEQELLTIKIRQNEEAIKAKDLEAQNAIDNADYDKNGNETSESIKKKLELNRQYNQLLIERNKLKNEGIELNSPDKNKSASSLQAPENFSDAAARADDYYKQQEALLNQQHYKELISEDEFQKQLKDLKEKALSAQFGYGKISLGNYLLEIESLEEKYTKFLKDEYAKRAKDAGQFQAEAKESYDQYIQDQIDKEDKVNEDKNKKEKDAELKATQQTVDGIFAIQQQGIQNEKKINDEKLSETAKQLNEQLVLQAAGRKNTADFLLAQQAQQQAKAAELDRQAAKAKEAEQLANIFLEAMKANAGKGISAVAISLAETLAAKAIASSLSGNFAEGIENFAGEGTETSDSNIIGFSKGESVVTAKGTRENIGLVTAMNKGNVDKWVMENIYPKIPVQVDRSPNESATLAMASMLHKEIKDLKQTIKDKKEIGLSKDIKGHLVIIETENGKSQAAIQIPSPIIQRPKPFSRN